jgi:hypothetical protein
MGASWLAVMPADGSASARDIAFVFQLFALYPHMNVRQNIAFPLRCQNYPRAEIRRSVEETARLLRIDHLLDRRVGGLSGGDRQRVALGRAIVREPMAFLMDEAEFMTSNSDGTRDYAVSDKDIFNALTPRLMRGGKGMLISTPWPTETLMGTMFEENWAKCKTAVAIKAPTPLVRGNDPHIAEMVQLEMTRDPALKSFFDQKIQYDNLKQDRDALEKMMVTTSSSLCLPRRRTTYSRNQPGRRTTASSARMRCHLVISPSASSR